MATSPGLQTEGSRDVLGGPCGELWAGSCLLIYSVLQAANTFSFPFRGEKKKHNKTTRTTPTLLCQDTELLRQDHFCAILLRTVTVPPAMPSRWGACSACSYCASFLLHLICHLVASEEGNSLLNTILDSLLLPVVRYFSSLLMEKQVEAQHCRTWLSWCMNLLTCRWLSAVRYHKMCQHCCKCPHNSPSQVSPLTSHSKFLLLIALWYSHKIHRLVKI